MVVDVVTEVEVETGWVVVEDGTVVVEPDGSVVPEEVTGGNPVVGGVSDEEPGK